MLTFKPYKSDCEACTKLIAAGIPPKAIGILSTKLRNKKDLSISRTGGYSRRFLRYFKLMTKNTNYIDQSKHNKEIMRKCAICIKAKRIQANRLKPKKGESESVDARTKRLAKMNYYKNRWVKEEAFNKFYATLKKYKQRRKEWVNNEPERKRKWGQMKSFKRENNIRHTAFKKKLNQQKQRDLELEKMWDNPDMGTGKVGDNFNILDHDLQDLEKFSKEIEILTEKKIKEDKKKIRRKNNDDIDFADLKGMGYR